MKTVLIIGAAGFVGSYLIKNLKSHNYKVIPTKLKKQKVEDKSFIDLDVLNTDNIKKVLLKCKPDYIIHLAAQANVGLSWKDPILTFNINVMGSLNLLNEVHTLGIKPRILLVGTSEEYGQIRNAVINETDVGEPNNFYALSKITQEKIGQIYSKVYGLDIIFTRSFNHIGPGQSKGFVVPDICSQIVEIEKGLKKPILHIGNLRCERDFTDVRDVANAYRLLIEKGKIGEIYNVGSGQKKSIDYILNKLLSFSDEKIKVVASKSKIRPTEIISSCADISKLVDHTKFKIRYNIDDSLYATLEYFRKR